MLFLIAGFVLDEAKAALEDAVVIGQALLVVLLFWSIINTQPL